jgi:hypothetical protein
VTSTSAADSAVDVAINGTVRATFSEAMDPATIVAANFTLMDGTTPVTGTVTYDTPNTTAIFAPESILTEATVYTATVTSAATDAAGNGLAADKVWTFTTAAPGRVTPDYSDLGGGEIGGQTLAPGLYKWGTSVGISTDVTIAGASNDVWIFQIANDLTVSNGVDVILSGGAQARNIFWQVAGEATLGTTSHFEGLLLSQTAIALATGATANGRLLAQSAVTLDQSTVVQPAE